MRGDLKNDEKLKLLTSRRNAHPNSRTIVLITYKLYTDKSPAPVALARFSRQIPTVKFTLGNTLNGSLKLARARSISRYTIRSRPILSRGKIGSAIVVQTPKFMNIPGLLKEKRERILEVAAKYGAYNVRIFGSMVRGEANDKSDIDFLVQLEPRCGLFDWLHLEEDLEKLLGKRVDVIQEEAMKGKMRERALKEAIPL